MTFPIEKRINTELPIDEHQPFIEERFRPQLCPIRVVISKLAHTDWKGLYNLRRSATLILKGVRMSDQVVTHLEMSFTGM